MGSCFSLILGSNVSFYKNLGKQGLLVGGTGVHPLGEDACVCGEKKKSSFLLCEAHRGAF